MKRNKIQSLMGFAVLITALVMIPSIGYAQDTDGDGIVTTDDPKTLAPIVVDGLFGGVGKSFFDSGDFVGNRSLEWGDVEWEGFIAPDDDTGTLFRTPSGDPNALTFASIAPGGPLEPDVEDLYLMYAFANRTASPDPVTPGKSIVGFADGDFIADIFFDITVPGDFFDETGDDSPISVPIVVEFRHP